MIILTDDQQIVFEILSFVKQNFNLVEKVLLI